VTAPTLLTLACTQWVTKTSVTGRSVLVSNFVDKPVEIDPFPAGAVVRQNIGIPYPIRGTIMKLVTVTLIACSLLPLTAGADDADDTLRFYLSKSDVVVLGTIKGEPESIVDEAGVPNYLCQFAVTDVAKGDAELTGKTIAINIVRFELNEKDRHPLIKKDAECILFLKKQRLGNVPQLTSADYWFGVQPPSPLMFKSLSRLAKETIAVDIDSHIDWIRIARKRIESDEAIQKKIGEHPFDPKRLVLEKTEPRV
jgi:hypothetical protein